jgi:hypothetical protein
VAGPSLAAGRPGRLRRTPRRQGRPFAEPGPEAAQDRKTDTELAGLRDRGAVAKPPTQEREACRKSRADVEAQWKQARE